MIKYLVILKNNAGYQAIEAETQQELSQLLMHIAAEVDSYFEFYQYLKDLQVSMADTYATLKAAQELTLPVTTQIQSDFDGLSTKYNQIKDL